MIIKATLAPILAGATSLLMALILIASGNLSGAGRLPLLTVLFICEFGFFVSAAGGVYGIIVFKKEGGKPLLLSSLCCLLMAVFFLFSGLLAWQGMTG